MTPERWRRVGELFAEALEVEGDDREQLLEAACRDDPELLREVEKLLDGHRRAGPFLESDFGATGVDSDAPTLDDPAARPPPWIGRRVGPYEILDEIGHGGMGTVYRARRADDSFDQRVAVKVIQRGLASAQVVRRFEQERQILAGLQHPNIAHLLDGGTTEDGLPYVVMELVDGEPIDRYCDRRRLGLGARLELFRTVCAAAQFAHRNLVVHRDLKTGNILVDRDGVVKLLDFGIAKVLDDEGDPSLTRTGVRPMTPEVASPEQMSRRPLTTASDVYSLGVLLFELLAGRRPFRRCDSTPSELERAVCEREPPRPSVAFLADGDETAAERATARRSEPARWRKRLVGDLDTIALTALRKEPERRYPSAAALAEDCRRHLAGLPVTARDDTWLYRTGKLVRRRPWAVLSTLAALLGVVGFTVALYLQGERVARERDRAQDLVVSWRQEQLATEQQRLKAEEVKDFLLDLFYDTNPGQAAGKMTVRELLDRGAARLDEGLERQPLVEADLRHMVGSVYLDLSAYDTAEKHVRRAVDLRSGGAEPAELADSLNLLGRLRYAQRDGDGATDYFERGLLLRCDVFGPDSLEVSHSLNNLAMVHAGRGEYEIAGSIWRQVLEQRRRLLGNEDAFVAQSLMNLGNLEANALGDLAAAEAYYRESLPIRRHLSGPRSQNTAVLLGNLGMTLSWRGDYETAEPLLRETLDIQHELFGPTHLHTASAMGRLGTLLLETGRLDEAHAMYTERLRQYRRLFGDEHPAVAESWLALARWQRASGDLTSALDTMQKGLRLRVDGIGEEHFASAVARAELADLGCATGRAQAYESEARQAVERLERALPESHFLIAQAQGILGGCLLANGKPDEAEPLIEESCRDLGRVLLPSAAGLRRACDRVEALRGARASDRG